MSKPLTTSLLLLTLLPAAAALGTGIPDLENSLIWLLDPAAAGATITSIPDGSGDPLSEALLPDGTPVDATVMLQLLDGGGFPIALFPFEDLWLESQDGGLALCPGGTVADVNTDAQGLTHWTDPLQAGGFSDSPCLVVINGQPQATTLDLSFNSADIDGDLQVNLLDVQLFAQDYFNAYHFRSDLHRDGALNLADVQGLAAALGRSCP